MLVFPKAKINLGLQIKHKREDGFHEIETCMYPIPLCDILEVISSEGNYFENTGISTTSKVEDDLCIKAKRILESSHKVEDSRLHLHKIIPHGAGLGGGSSDAVSTLKALNQINNLNLSDDQLTTISSELGSDCPFFVKNSPQLARGRGELLEEIDISLEGLYLIVVHPGFSISTPLAYSLISPKTPTQSLNDILSKPIEEWKKSLINDFQDVLENKYPELSDIRNKLYDEGALYASISGSGSAYFGIFKKEQYDFKTWFRKGYFVFGSILE